MSQKTKKEKLEELNKIPEAERTSRGTISFGRRHAVTFLGLPVIVEFLEPFEVKVEEEEREVDDE